MKLAIVPGKSRIDDAKIGGITPDVLILSGRCELWPLYIRRPTTRLAYCTGMRRCAALHEDDRRDDRDHHEQR